jgi:hypothetical protein
MKKISAAVLSAATLTACSTAPDKIQASYVSPIQNEASGRNGNPDGPRQLVIVASAACPRT